MLNRQQILVVGLFIVFGLAVLLIGVLSNPQPYIDSIEPRKAGAGDIVRLEGSSFGSSEEEGRVRIGGQAVPIANIREWSDTRIRFSVPGPGYSGLVHVRAHGYESNALLFINNDNVPTASGGQGDYAEPFIYSISPNVAAPGELVTLDGRDFGVFSSVGRIIVSPASDRGEELQFFPEHYSIPRSHIVLWSNDTIQFRAPHGIVTDELRLQTEYGESTSGKFELEGQVGTMQYRDPSTISIGLVVSARIEDSEEDNPGDTHEGVEDELVLWMPGASNTPAQRDLGYSRICPSPMFHNEDVFQFVFPYLQLQHRFHGDRLRELVRLNMTATRYAVETTLLEDQVSSDYNEDNPLYRNFLGSGYGVEVDDRAQRLGRELGGRSENPLTIARRLFSGIRERLSVDGDDPDSSQHYALETAALLRSRGIPARVITGVLVPPQASPRYHHWVEWYALDFGWVPMDPYIADALSAELEWTQHMEEEAEYYRENMDSYRLAIHRGGALPPRIDRFSPSHQLEGSPLVADNIAYGRLRNTELKLQWEDPILMYRQSR